MVEPLLNAARETRRVGGALNGGVGLKDPVPSGGRGN